MYIRAAMRFEINPRCCSQVTGKVGALAVPPGCGECKHHLLNKAARGMDSIVNDLAGNSACRPATRLHVATSQSCP